MLPENASEMVDRLSEEARAEEAVPGFGLFYKIICSSLVVLIHIFFFPLLDRRHSVSKMVSAVANGYEHSVR